MFTVNTEKFGEVRVSFIHHNPEKPCKKEALFHYGTYCSISAEDDEVVGRGSTVLAFGDQYDKNRGRKLSLARALKNAGFNRDERTEFWMNYFSTQNHTA